MIIGAFIFLFLGFLFFAFKSFCLSDLCLALKNDKLSADHNLSSLQEKFDRLYYQFEGTTKENARLQATLYQYEGMINDLKNQNDFVIIDLRKKIKESDDEMFRLRRINNELYQKNETYFTKSGAPNVATFVDAIYFNDCDIKTLKDEMKRAHKEWTPLKKTSTVSTGAKA